VNPPPVNGLRIDIRGVVQGVGFRPWVYRLATLAGVTGRVRNDGRGVSIDAFGPAGALVSFVAGLRSEAPPPAARIESLETSAIPAETVDGFTIVKSPAAPSATCRSRPTWRRAPIACVT
jgi:hydrogenase maturation protein HypF